MSMREDTLAILHYEDHKRFPLVHFGYWPETIQKWQQEGHLTLEEASDVYDGSVNETALSSKLGFDFNWNTVFGGNTGLLPSFERKILEESADGHQKVLDENGAVVLVKPGTVSIPSEIDHLLKDRDSWEKHYKHRLKMTTERISEKALEKFSDISSREIPVGIFCGSLYGNIRNYLGIEGACYLQADDEELFDEIINTNAQMQFEVAKAVLKTGALPDYGHFWEDICFKNGPLINPKVFAEKVGPWYRKFTDLLSGYGVDLISVDCDGMIDSLIPTWLENGVNVMFPIEVGTWGASIAPWREKYGRQIRGVGGMNKTVFARDFKSVDEEVERLIGLIDMGGYIPCPDHRIAPDAIWDNVQYYCERLRRAVDR